MLTVIRNPASGRGRRAALWERFAAQLPDATILLTERRGHATELAREAAKDGGVVVAAGGDGTINEVLQGVCGSTATLGLLPLGTGNDLARCLGITTENAVETLLRGVPKEVDVGTWTCGGSTGRFVNVAGCGFDAVVAQRINRGFRFLNGTSAYLASVLQSLMTYRAAQLSITVDGSPHQTTAMLCAVANATSYGGGMQIAPAADVSDGLLDLVIVQGVGRVEFLRAFPSVFKGTHIDHPKVTSMRGRQIEILSEPPLPVLADGEIVGVTPVTFEIEEGAIKILVPGRGHK